MNEQRTHGQWFRHGDRIVLLLKGPPAGEEHEVGGGQDDAAKAIQAAIKGGLRDENRLTDMVFNTRHPERHGQRIQPQEQGLVKEWVDTRDRLVRPALRASAPSAAPPSTTSGLEADGDQTHTVQCILGLQDQGRKISFVQRYLRDLHPPEVAALKKAGLKIVSCYEFNQSDPPASYFTRAQGKHDGRLGFTQAQAAGQPAGTPVYFAVDQDPTKSMLDYFRGIAEGHKQYLVDMKAKGKPEVSYAIGVYGGRCLLEWCQSAGLATWFWQSFAQAWCQWDNRNVWSGANIHTSGLDTPARCGERLGHLEGWGNEGGW